MIVRDTVVSWIMREAWTAAGTTLARHGLYDSRPAILATEDELIEYMLLIVRDLNEAPERFLRVVDLQATLAMVGRQAAEAVIGRVN